MRRITETIMKCCRPAAVSLVLAILIAAAGCRGGSKSPGTTSITDDSLLNLVQYRTFQYFWNGAESHSGMARERLHMDGIYPHDDKSTVTTGGSGFGVMAILAGIERGYISRQEALERLEKIVDFLEKADRFHGMWPHWIYGETGKVKPFSKKDNGADAVESAYMFQGLLTVRQYFREGSDRERALAGRIDKLWREAEWSWFRRDQENVLYWHWSPTYGWAMNHQVRGYNECLIYYILAASSPTYPVPPEVYHQGWARGGEIDTTVVTYGYTLTLNHHFAAKYGGPLFWEHYSYLGLDPRGLVDRYADYWVHNVNHTLINRQYCIENPGGYAGYGPGCWGLTSSYTWKEGGEVGYMGHRPGRDNGVIAPTAALSSIVYTPEYSMDAMRTFYGVYGDSLLGEYGFYDAFSPERDWFTPRYLAIDQGPIVVMLENYRTGLLWKLFMSCPEIQAGLDKLGFEYSVI